MDDVSLQHVAARLGHDVASVIDGFLYRAYQPDRDETRQRYGICMDELRALQKYASRGDDWSGSHLMIGELQRCRADPTYLTKLRAEYERRARPCQLPPHIMALLVGVLEGNV